MGNDKISSMRSIWKGSISFGLVNVPVSLYPATQREELKFRLLRSGDLSPINYKRIAEIDGKEVPWNEVVKGYEYEKGKFVVLKDEDFKRIDIEATQTIDIMDFVELEEINPIFFSKPYYLEPQKGAGRVYNLLREALKQTEKTGISKVVIKTREYLAAVKPNGDAIVLEVMHFADELLDQEQLHLPKKEKVAPKELEMAKALIGQMTTKWDPTRYTDDYKSALIKMIETKIKSGGKQIPTVGKRPAHPDNVIDLMGALRQSLEQSGATRKKSTAASKTPKRKKVA